MPHAGTALLQKTCFLKRTRESKWNPATPHLTKNSKLQRVSNSRTVKPMRSPPGLCAFSLCWLRHMSVHCSIQYSVPLKTSFRPEGLSISPRTRAQDSYRFVSEAETMLRPSGCSGESRGAHSLTGADSMSPGPPLRAAVFRFLSPASVFLILEPSINGTTEYVQNM